MSDRRPKPWSAAKVLRSGERVTTASILEMYGIYISYIRHENELLHHRTTWFLAIQTALGAAIGFVFRKYFQISAAYALSPDMVPPLAVIEAAAMWLACCFFGGFTSWNAYVSIKAAQKAQDKIEWLWETSFTEQERAEFPDMMGGKSSHKAKNGGRLARMLSAVITGFWITLLAPPLALAISKAF